MSHHSHCRDLEPHEHADITVTVTAKRPGVRKLMASFQSKELMDVTGQVDIEVVKD